MPSHGWIRAFMLVALIVSALGVGTVAAQEDPLADVDPTGQEIVWWHNHSREREQMLLALIEEFNEANEWGITVVAENQGSYDDIRDKMNAAIASGELPALVVGYQNDQAFYQQANALVDINPYVNSATWGLSEEEIADFYPGFWAQDVHPAYDYQRLAIPPNRSMTVMYYNVEWLQDLGYDAPPETWAEFKEVACAASDPDSGIYGYSHYDSASNLASMVFGLGGNIITEDQSAYTFNTPEVIEALTILQDLVTEGCGIVAAEEYGNQADFANRRALFTFGSSSGLPYYENDVNESEQGPFEWTVTAFPHAEGGEPVVDVYGASILMPRTTDEKQLAAWLFLKWFTGPEIQGRWVEISGYFPTRASTVDYLQDYLEENPLYAASYALLGVAKLMFEPQGVTYNEIRALMDEASARAMAGDDITAIVEDIQEAADEVVEEFAE
jgi:multiple sugar transport system substrate-binding protein